VQLPISVDPISEKEVILAGPHNWVVVEISKFLGISRAVLHRFYDVSQRIHIFHNNSPGGTVRLVFCYDTYTRAVYCNCQHTAPYSLIIFRLSTALISSERFFDLMQLSLVHLGLLGDFLA